MKQLIYEFLHLTLELIIGFFSLLLITRFLGKTQINQITPFEFISGLVLGELLGNALYDKDINIFYILYALFLWGFLMFMVGFITQKYMKTRKFFEGNPSIVVKHGKIDFDVLKKEKIDMNELLSLLRGKDVFSIRQVEYALLEPNGTISVLKKSKYENPTIEDLSLPENSVYLPVTFILDGEIIKDNLKDAGFDETWLITQINSQGVSKAKDVMYADWQEDEGIYVLPYKKHKKNL